MWDGKYKTTFWEDFSIAEKFGRSAIKDTYHRAFEEWKDNIEYLTELVMVINHKSWYWHEHHNDFLCEFYSDLYYTADAQAYEYLKEHGSEDDREYYWETLD